MMVYLLRWVLLLTVLLVFPVALIRARPYDDGKLRAFLALLDSCPSPCFMGIRPGETTAVEAIGILENHKWVARLSGVDPRLFERPADMGNLAIPVIYWNWDQARPSWIDATGGGELWSAASRRVQFMKINTTFLTGDIWLTLGEPDATDIVWMPSAAGHRRWRYAYWYETGGVLLITEGRCPFRQSDLYFGQTRLQLQAYPPAFYGESSFDTVCRP